MLEVDGILAINMLIDIYCNFGEQLFHVLEQSDHLQ